MTIFSRTLAWLTLICFVFALAVGPIFFGAVHVPFASLTQSLVAAGFLAVLARSLVLGRSIVRDALDGVMMLCWVYITIRYFTSSHEYQSRQEWLMASAAFEVYFGMRVYCRKEWISYTLLFVMIFIASLISLYALYQKFSGTPDVLWLKTAYPGRVTGTYYCPNHLAGFLEFFIPLVLAWVLFTRLSIGKKLLLAYLVLIMAGAHLFSFSRGGLLSCVAACGLVFFLGWRHKAFATLILILAATVGVLVFAHFLKTENLTEFNRYTDAFHGEWSRKAMWESAVQLWKQSPWFGLGPMQFEWWHASVRGNVPWRAVYVHNDYLQVLVDYGAVGAVLLLGFLVFLLSKVYSGCRKYGLLKTTRHHPHVVMAVDEAFRRATFLGVTASVAALLIHSVVDFNLHIPANALLFALFVAIGHNLAENDFEKMQMGWGGKNIQRSLALVLLFGVLWQGRLIWINFKSDQLLNQANYYKKELEWNRAEDSYKSAVAEDPKNSEAWAHYANFLYQRSILDVIKTSEYQNAFLAASERALQLNPLNKILRIRRGEILDRMARVDEAEKEYADAIAFDSRNAYFYNKFGLHYKRLGMTVKAREMFEQAAKYPGGGSTSALNLKTLGPIKEETLE